MNIQKWYIYYACFVPLVYFCLWIYPKQYSNVVHIGNEEAKNEMTEVHRQKNSISKVKSGARFINKELIGILVLP
jgi:hypothetical protein